MPKKESIVCLGGTRFSRGWSEITIGGLLGCLLIKNAITSSEKI